jgi:uncharacterized protein YqgC (DUF456 family)
LLLLHFTKTVDLPGTLLIVLGIVTVVVTILDYVVPAWGTKKSGGSKAGIRGATAGLIVGLFLGPAGIIVGPFAGAVIGEMIGGSGTDKALRAGFGSFLGFLAGTGLKLMASITMAFYFFKYVISLI